MYNKLLVVLFICVTAGPAHLALADGMLTAHARVFDSPLGQFVPLEIGGYRLGYDDRYQWLSFPDTLVQEPQLYIWQVTGTGGTDPLPEYGNISFEVLTNGPVLLATTSRWGGGGNSSGGWIPELTSLDEFLADGWVEHADPMLLQWNGDPVTYNHYTVYIRESVAGEHFTYRTEKYHPPLLLTTDPREFSEFLANVSFSDSADLDLLEIGFGTLPTGSPEPSVAFSITNLASPSQIDADLNLDSFTVSGDTHILTTDLHSFIGLSPGESNDFTASMRTDTSGTFSVNAFLNFIDADGYEQRLTLNLTGEVPYPLQAGDVNQDYTFDQLDLVDVFLANKYLTGQPATWGEGDWNGAPGGSPGNPPAGDGLFDQKDIVAALAPGHYLSGTYASLAANGREVDDQTSDPSDARTDELAVDAPAGTDLNSFNINSDAGIFTGTAQNLGGGLNTDSDTNVFKATFGSSLGSLSSGHVVQQGLAEDPLLHDLTVVGSLANGRDPGPVDLIYVPEPSTVVLALVGLLSVVTRFRGGEVRLCPALHT